MPLSQKHEAVALAYLTDPQHIGWKAYKSVYPKSSRHACETSWTSLLKNPEFSARIADLGEQAAQGAVATARQVLEEITKIALDAKEKASDRLHALDDLAQYHGLFRPDRDRADELRTKSDGEIFDALAREASELGIEIGLTFNGKGK